MKDTLCERIPFLKLTYGDRRQTKQFLHLRRRLSSGGGKPGLFSAFGREIPCETTDIIYALFDTVSRNGSEKCLLHHILE